MRHLFALPAVTLAGLSVAALAGYAPATAASAETAAKPARSFSAMESMSYVLGSKRAIGYFLQANGRCQVTLMIAEAAEAVTAIPPSAAKLTVAMVPGQKADLFSEEGELIAVTCGADAQTVEITRVTAPRS